MSNFQVTWSAFSPFEAEKTGRPETPLAEDFEKEGIEGLSFFWKHVFFGVFEKRCKFTLFYCCSDIFSKPQRTRYSYSSLRKQVQVFTPDNFFTKTRCIQNSIFAPTQGPAEAFGEYFSRWLTDGWLVCGWAHICKVMIPLYNKAFYRIVSHQTASKKTIGCCSGSQSPAKIGMFERQLFVQTIIFRVHAIFSTVVSAAWRAKSVVDGYQLCFSGNHLIFHCWSVGCVNIVNGVFSLLSRVW